ncbi:hypothetical protein BaRGS_00020447 [Batillaria attramentaria]|uniref:Uncharacterized protein n=1 Tax=Batillaria attramentaria TaxID=370345 RepID=A0ABD0KLZ2_9CAEN
MVILDGLDRWGNSPGALSDDRLMPSSLTGTGTAGQGITHRWESPVLDGIGQKLNLKLAAPHPKVKKEMPFQPTLNKGYLLQLLMVSALTDMIVYSKHLMSIQTHQNYREYKTEATHDGVRGDVSVSV